MSIHPKEEHSKESMQRQKGDKGMKRGKVREGGQQDKMKRTKMEKIELKMKRDFCPTRQPCVDVTWYHVCGICWII